MAHAAEWVPVSIGPPDVDLEVCVIGFDGNVHSLMYPCHRSGTEWVDASSQKHLHIQPTHWRKWTEAH
jgi:hypothetical protein